LNIKEDDKLLNIEEFYKSCHEISMNNIESILKDSTIKSVSVNGWGNIDITFEKDNEIYTFEVNQHCAKIYFSPLGKDTVWKSNLEYIHYKYGYEIITNITVDELINHIKKRTINTIYNNHSVWLNYKFATYRKGKVIK